MLGLLNTSSLDLLPSSTGPSFWRHLHEASEIQTVSCKQEDNIGGSVSLARAAQETFFRHARKRKQFNFKVCVRVSARGCYSDLSIPTKLSLSWAVSVGKSSSVSLAFPAAIFFSSSPPPAAAEAEPRLRAAAQAATATDTPHDCMENRDAGTKGLLRQIKERKPKKTKRSKTFFPRLKRCDSI